MENLPAPWYDIATGDGTCEALERQLVAECNPGHQLFGRRVKAIARRHDRDDVLFLLVDEEPAVAEVHLTWGHHQAGPEWPATVVYSSIEEWAAVPRDEIWAEYE